MLFESSVLVEMCFDSCVLYLVLPYGLLAVEFEPMMVVIMMMMAAQCDYCTLSVIVAFAHVRERQRWALVVTCKNYCTA